MSEDHDMGTNAASGADAWRIPAAKTTKDQGPGWLERVFGINTRGGKLGCLGTVAAVIALPIMGVSYCSYQAAEQTRLAEEQKAKDDAVQAERDEQSYKASVASGAVCVDGPDGLNTAFELNVKRRLKDPDSFEHMGTVITPSKKGGYDALMRFRSRNSFGGYAVGTAIGHLYVAERGVCEVRDFRVSG